jgi:predicted kinase
MTVIFLSGPPGSGKSTYARQHLSDFILVSKDDIIFREAERVGKTYNEIFSDYSARANEILFAQIKGLVQQKIDFVIDMTNVSEESRKLKLQLIPSYETKIALYFPSYTVDVLETRINKRGTHSVPREGIQKMHDNYRLPQKTEGFDLVASASHFIDIMKVMEFK